MEIKPSLSPLFRHSPGMVSRNFPSQKKQPNPRLVGNVKTKQHLQRRVRGGIISAYMAIGKENRK